MIHLPKDLLITILADLDLSVLGKICQSSLHLNRICNDKQLWVTKYQNEFGETFPWVYSNYEMNLYLTKKQDQLCNQLKQGYIDLLYEYADADSVTILNNLDISDAHVTNLFENYTGINQLRYKVDGFLMENKIKMSGQLLTQNNLYDLYPYTTDYNTFITRLNQIVLNYIRIVNAITTYFTS